MLVNDFDQFVKDTLVVPTIDEKSGIHFDFVFSFSAYKNEARRRANRIKLEDTLVNFASLEDLIIHKLIAGRPRDIEDIKSIILKNPKYDSNYIEKWAKEFDASLGEEYNKLFLRIIEELNN